MKEWLFRLVPVAGVWYLRLLWLTGRYSVKGEENLERVEREYGRGVWVCWHNRLLGAILMHRGRGMGAMISKSRDGEMIAGVVEKLGYVALRGSTSRASAAVLKSALRHLKGGRHVVFTPDGPRGPRYKAQPGAAYAAQRAGVPVLPLGVGASWKKVFGSWDRFQLPLPFSRVQVVYGEPIFFGPEETVEEMCAKIDESLMKAAREADELLGVDSP